MCALDIHTVSLFVLRLLSVNGFRADYFNIQRRGNANLHNFIIRSICLLEIFCSNFLRLFDRKILLLQLAEESSRGMCFNSNLLKFSGDFAFCREIAHSTFFRLLTISNEEGQKFAGERLPPLSFKKYHNF
jgi:hypothetical protein